METLFVLWKMETLIYARDKLSCEDVKVIF
ncbi:hypothetical protein Goklo_006122 [Gossypium klotzschianum]|uniref:Uncharacterized protein n=1 Tax=Gossypium klotzschianum TaxID=34286 RepID=A0A7J8VGH2_9ROSI|nr:hypothetical protein [Gossypium klotzschianum]